MHSKSRYGLCSKFTPQDSSGSIRGVLAKHSSRRQIAQQQIAMHLLAATQKPYTAYNKQVPGTRLEKSFSVLWAERIILATIPGSEFSGNSEKQLIRAYPTKWSNFSAFFKTSVPTLSPRKTFFSPTTHFPCFSLGHVTFFPTNQVCKQLLTEPRVPLGRAMHVVTHSTR